MKKPFSIMFVCVLLCQQYVLDVSLKDIQNLGEAVVPWFQIGAASLTIVKHGTEFLEKRDKTDNKDRMDDSGDD